MIILDCQLTEELEWVVNFRSGKKSYSLASGGIEILRFLSKKYLLTLWLKTGASINVNG